MVGWFRRGWCAAIVAIASLMPFVSRPAFAETTLTVGKSAATSDALTPVNIGDQLGIFKKHGLDLKIIDFTGGSKMAQAMAAGSLDIGAGAGTELAFVAKGAPMIGVCENTAPAPFMGIGVAWDSPIKSLSDLKGKVIAVSSSGSFTDWLGHELARKEGWGDDGVKIAPVGGGTVAGLAALRSHQVDAVLANSTQFFSFEESKDERFMASVAAYEGNVASGTIFASNALIASNPDSVRAFIAAWLETIDYMRAHKAETVKMLSALNHFDETVMAREYDLTIGMFTKDCRFDAESMATLKRSFHDMQLVDGDVDVSKLYTEAYLPK